MEDFRTSECSHLSHCQRAAKLESNAALDPGGSKRRFHGSWMKFSRCPQSFLSQARLFSKLPFLMEPRITLLTLGVADLPRAVRFYRDGLGWLTTYEDGDPVAFFQTGGTRLSLYPLVHLAADIGPEVAPVRTGFGGITLAHNVRTKPEVAEVLALAARVGGQIVKPAQDVFWGGHSGYFTDPDGYHWEVAWNPIMPLDERGEMNLTP
jgi:catechol 2,3-dioxygenase-like lactoylglutathione lyase family enzyme